MEANNTPLDQDQKRRSRILAISVFAVWIIMQILARTIYPELDLFGRPDFLKWQAVTFALALVFGVINLENNFTSNENWKTFGGIASIALSIFLAWIFISEGLK